jgi:hypothetical protein
MKALVHLLVSLILMLHAAALQRHAGRAASHQRAAGPLSDAPPRANEGHLPPPPRRQAASIEHRQDGSVNSTPHVNHDHWYGQDGEADSRYRILPLSQHDTVAELGPKYRYAVVATDRKLRRISILPGSSFEVAAWDWSLFEDWCLDCGRDFAIYKDPDHPDWYLLYNVHTGTYVHILCRRK